MVNLPSLQAEKQEKPRLGSPIGQHTHSTVLGNLANDWVESKSLSLESYIRHNF